MPHTNDGQQTIFNVWQNGHLNKGVFGYGTFAMDEETQVLANYILSLIEAYNVSTPKTDILITK